MSTITIQVRPEILKRLQSKAAEDGTTVEAVVQEFLEGQTPSALERVPTKMTPQEWSARWQAWVDRYKVTNVIADDSRESIYEGCGE